MKKTLLACALLTAHGAFAKDLFFHTENVHAEYPDSAQAKKFYELCEDGISTDILRIKTNRPAIDAVINKEIPDEQAAAAYYRDSIEEILEMAEGMAKEDLGVTMCTRELQYRPGYIGHYKNIEQFIVVYYEYAGGAHGIYGDSYYLFDDNDRRLSLADVLEADGETRLNDLLKAAYIAYLEDMHADTQAEAPSDSGGKNAAAKVKPVKGEAALREAELLDSGYLRAVIEEKDNFYFSDKGLVFSYVPYQAGSYAEGQIELTLPYKDLSGVIKAAYLP